MNYITTLIYFLISISGEHSTADTRWRGGGWPGVPGGMRGGWSQTTSHHHLVVWGSQGHAARNRDREAKHMLHWTLGLKLLTTCLRTQLSLLFCLSWLILATLGFNS